MASSVVLVLDTIPPAAPSLVLADGTLATGQAVVPALVSSSSADAYEFKIWGDLDVTADSRFQATEAQSDWMLYDGNPITIKLSATQGSKTVFARLRDDVGNATPALSDTIVLNTAVPLVSILVPPPRNRISHVQGFSTLSFGWRSNVAYTRWEVRVVPTAGSGHQSGTVLSAADGVFIAEQVRTSVIDSAALAAASPGNGPKIVKAYVRGVDGTWSV